MLIHVII